MILRSINLTKMANLYWFFTRSNSKLDDNWKDGTFWNWPSKQQNPDTHSNYISLNQQRTHFFSNTTK